MAVSAHAHYKWPQNAVKVAKIRFCNKPGMENLILNNI